MEIYETDLQMYVISVYDKYHSSPRSGTINVVAESMEKAVNKVTRMKPEFAIQQATVAHKNVVVPWVSDSYYDDKDSEDSDELS